MVSHKGRPVLRSVARPRNARRAGSVRYAQAVSCRPDAELPGEQSRQLRSERRCRVLDADAGYPSTDAHDSFLIIPMRNELARGIEPGFRLGLLEPPPASLQILQPPRSRKSQVREETRTNGLDGPFVLFPSSLPDALPRL